LGEGEREKERGKKEKYLDKDCLQILTHSHTQKEGSKYK